MRSRPKKRQSAIRRTSSPVLSSVTLDLQSLRLKNRVLDWLSLVTSGCIIKEFPITLARQYDTHSEFHTRGKCLRLS